MTYKLGSLFDGSGGFPLSGALCGIEPVWAAEVEPYPIAVTRSRFPKMKHLGDISKVNGADIEPVDIITFGSPCQDLSVAGKRAGLKHEANGDDETTRSGLFMEAVRIIKEMRKATNGEYPRFALWENVPGAFSSNKGEDFRIVCEELIKIVEPRAAMPAVPAKGWAYADSYIGDGWSLAYRVFDAQYWGVPQRRRRIHLVVDFRGQCAREVLFEREGVRGYFAEGRAPWQAAPSYAQDCSGADDREGESSGGTGGRQLDAVGFDAYNQASTGELSKPLTASASDSDHTPVVCYAVENHPADSRVNIDDSGKVQTLTSRMGTGGGNVPMVMEALQTDSYIDVEMEVAVRKYEVNCKLLCECLRDHKFGSNFSNQDISESLDLPLTQVEHWFRQDQYFAIPEPEVWPKLKKLLGIETTEFDQSIMEFEFKGGTYDMRNRIHLGETSPTLTCGCGNDLHLLPKEPTCVADHPTPKVDEKGTAFTLSARDYKNPQAVGYAMQAFGVYKEGGVGSSLKMRDYKDATDLVVASQSSAVQVRYIVRRLTPTECARLQGFADQHGHLEIKTDLTDEAYQFWMDVRNTHAAINGKAVKEYTKAQMLTWYNKLWTDAAEYKMWGNGIALPPALYCMQGIMDVLNREEDDSWML